jgi:hypothetical protein
LWERVALEQLRDGEVQRFESGEQPLRRWICDLVRRELQRNPAIHTHFAHAIVVVGTRTEREPRERVPNLLISRLLPAGGRSGLARRILPVTQRGEEQQERSAERAAAMCSRHESSGGGL